MPAKRGAVACNYPVKAHNQRERHIRRATRSRRRILVDSKLYEKIEQANAAVEELRSRGLPKPEPVSRLVARLAEEANMYPVPNLAVEVCLEAYTSNKKSMIDKGAKAADVEQIARLAYAARLPMLSNADCIRDFIACVVHGMAIGAVASSDGTRLLYGAQVAHSALPGGKKRRTKRIKNTPKTASAETANQSV
jgi:hypothetical protein